MVTHLGAYANRAPDALTARHQQNAAESLLPQWSSSRLLVPGYGSVGCGRMASCRWSRLMTMGKLLVLVLDIKGSCLETYQHNMAYLNKPTVYNIEDTNIALLGSDVSAN
jgi:hypothetical protein